MIVVLFLFVLASGTHARHRWIGVPGPESSSRDLDVGIAVGVPEDDSGFVFNQQGDAFNLEGVSDPRSNGMVYSTPGIQANNIKALVQPLSFGPLTASVRQLPLTALATNPDTVNLAHQQQQLAAYQQEFPPVASMQSTMPFHGFPDDSAQQQQMIVNQQGVPVMTAHPYGYRRIGAFKLRNDRGYQVMMEVPPSPTGADKDGVLVMEMKATLYRPVQ